jgi:sterol 3beta-glucosyltransferase
MGRAKKLIFEATEEWFAGTMKIGQDVDMVILGGTSIISGLGLLERRPNIKAIVLNLQPSTPSQFYAPHIFGTSQSWFNWINTLKWKVLGIMAWKLWRDKVNEMREKYAGLPPLTEHFKEHLAKVLHQPLTTITAYSAHIFPRPSDWPHHEHIVPPILDQLPKDFSPPEDIENFLNEGDSPVYLGLGSMMRFMLSREEQHKTVRIWVEGLNIVGKRGVIQVTGIDGLEELLAELSHNKNIFFVTNNVPHSWLFAKCSAAVHHGGSGTMHAALAAGLPSLLLPVLADQPFNGDIIYRNKLGPQPIPIKKLNLKSFVNALRLLFEEEMKQAAARIGSLLRQENGIEDIVKLVQKELNRP